MKSRAILCFCAAAAAAMILSSAAAASPISTSFTIVGYEYAFTSTVGSFAGVGSGNAAERATWNATVDHDRLGSTPTYIDGGSIAMATASATGRLDYVTGTFGYHAGTITTLDPGANCSNQKYRVTGNLNNVATSTTSGGSGGFSVVLTHYRYSVFGYCIIYKARVAGTASFGY
jgi:hypothetical protein